MTVRKMPVAIAGFVLLFLCWAGSYAAEKPFSDVAAHRMVVFYVNTRGEWDRVVQDQWDKVGSVAAPDGFRMVPPMGALRGDLMVSMPAAQREALLRRPEMLLAASRCRQAFDVRYVVLNRYNRPGDGRTMPVLYDVLDGSHLVLPEVRVADLARSQAFLAKNLQAGLARISSPVWGHILSKQYHVTNCDHVRADQTIVIASEQEARRNSYEPCAVCFPGETDYHRRNSAEISLGREVASYIERRYHTDTNTETQARVERVGRRLIQANGLYAFHYTFRVLDVDEMNAFAAGAGAVYITRGLERLTAGDDDMLAAVLGHEIGHTEGHHLLRQYRQAQTWSILGAVVSVSTGAYWPGLVTNFFGGILGRGYSRGFELEADRMGLIYTYDAGYRPEDFILVINALKKVSSDRGTPGWLRTHPTEEKRLERTRGLVANLQGLDKVATSYGAVDPGLTDYIRRHGVLFVDHTQELANDLPLYVAAFGPTEATPSGGIGVPVPGNNVSGNNGKSGSVDSELRVQPGRPDESPRFIHD